MSYIEINNVSKSYKNKKVFENISLKIDKHKFVSFIGSYGSGKTTLLKMIAGLLTGLDSCKLLDLITINPAKYMKINSGSITEGNKADILFYNMNSLNFTYNKSIIENLIYTFGNKPEIVIKDGKIIIENYMFKNKMEYDIIQEKNRIINLIENNVIF